MGGKNKMTDNIQKMAEDIDRDMLKSINATEKSERLSNFSLGFSIFVLIVTVLIELLIKK